MAESFLIGIAHSILGRLGSAALQQTFSLLGVKNDLLRLKKTLLTIRDVLLDAEEQQPKNREENNWLEDLKEVLCDADDFLDEIEIYGLRRKLNSRTTKQKVRGFFSPSNPVAFRFRMANKIKEIKGKLDDIAADKDKFHLPPALNVNGRDLQINSRNLTYSFVLPSNVIGRNHEKEEMVNVLMNTSNEEYLSVCSVIGMGGMGKTTLAKLVYNDERTVKHFQLRIWVCVSQNFDVKKLTGDITSHASGKPCDSLNNFDQVLSYLQDSLSDKRFLLVLDDVWNEDRPKWIELRSFLTGKAYGSKILVTTRSEYVASVMESSYVHKLKGLPGKDCLALLMRWAFRNGQEKQYPNLIKIGEDIVKKCKGVPLAVRTLGSLLYMKTDECEWLSVRDNEIWQWEQSTDDILPALRLSYNKLPYYLKQLFAYCSIFPKGHDIASVMLIQLWMAQGLLCSSGENEELEDVGIRYVKELCLKSFLEEVEAFDSFITCKMHDLVYDLAVSVSKNECLILDKQRGKTHQKSRHVTLNNHALLQNEVSNSILEPKRIRTIFLHPVVTRSQGVFSLGDCISRLKYLRVLDLSYSHLDTLPLSIGDMKHLRYINLSGNDNIKSLPSTICRLQSLQTLRLVLCTQLQKLPRHIGDLIRLRHLYVTTRETSFPEKGLGSLISLQTLSIQGCEDLGLLCEGIGKLTNLRTFVIGDCPRLTHLPTRSLELLVALENLMIINCEELALSDWQDFQGFLSLRSLVIGGLPRVMALPQLVREDTDTLQSIRISTCPSIGALPTWLGNVGSLRKIEIKGCPKLSSLPEGLRHVTGLKLLKIDKCPDLSKRCEKELGEDWPKISHVQEIYLNGIKI
ncbi:hypothetical protein M9H77_04114 [Catharanthus roseus]|uniref:Uncharacterized protein n=1 Tax=Catharanthus roseus TaxID=4058 RepID=A0ACC0CDM9_CATRO|nr:hypothetical protein M9H77_04114 [Catharanthus roseus]